MRRRLVVIAVGNAQPSTKIDMRDGVSICTQYVHELGKQRERITEWIELRDLAADMHVDAGDFEALQFARMSINLARAADWNAKLVLGLAGGNLVMGLRVDVRIDANRNRGGASFRFCDRRQQFKLRLGFDVDTENSFIDCQA